jgi:hypothetical protein
MNMIVFYLLRSLQAYEYHVPPSVESECFPYFLTNEVRNHSATRIVLSKEMCIPRISFLLIESTAIHNNQAN